MNKILLVTLICLGLLTSLNSMADYVIYPVPHKAVYGEGCIALTKSVNAVVEPGVDNYTIERLKEVLTQENGVEITFGKKAKKGVSNIYLGVKGSKGAADKYMGGLGIDASVFANEGKYDKHIVSIVPAGKEVADIVIVGEHTNAVFYGLATIEQILEAKKVCEKTGNTMVNPVTIYDYADMQYRGVVEGYYGYPYSFEVKKDLMRFFKRYKMNTYLYGAKSDPYHSGFWRDAYPEKITPIQQKNGWLSQDMIKDLSKLSLETKVNFIWAIHPNSGKSVDYHTKESTQKATDDVMSKFDKMHSLGIRQFAIFLDDAGWDFDDVDNYRDHLTDLQKGLENKYNKNYKNASDTVMPIHYVPHIYAINFARPNDLKTYFDAISQTSSNIVVYTTGSGVWSSLKNEDFVTMEKLMKRPVALWWNYPCNDNKDGRIYTADMYSTLHEMGLPTPDSEIPQCLGIVSNPMQQGTVAKIGLFGVADYSWNSKAFDTNASWKASFPAIIGKENAPLYNYLAKYLRYEDPKSLDELIKKYENGFVAGNYDGKALGDTILAINKATTQMLNMKPQNESDQLLFQDLKPWLVKLKKMTELATTLLSMPTIKDEQQKWALYCEVNNTLQEFKTNPIYMVDALEGMGENPPSELHRVEPSHKYLMPFIEWMVKSMYNLADNTESTLYSMDQGRYLTIMATLANDGTCTINTGNNPIDLMPSETTVKKNGKTKETNILYSPLSIILPKAGTIESANISNEIFSKCKVEYTLYSEAKVVKSAKDLVGKQVKMITITNKSNEVVKLNAADFVIKIPSAPAIESAAIPEGRIYDKHDASKLFDGNYNTFTCLYRDQRDGDTYTVKLAKKQPIYDVTLALGTTNLDFPKVAQVQISADNTNWTTLKVEGTDIEDMRMSMPQVNKLNSDVSLCSFVGNGSEAQYVRFVLKESFQEKWLRLNEIAVNPQHLEAQFVPVASVNGKPVVEVVDAKANTSYTPATDDETLVYNLINWSFVIDKLYIYAEGNGTATITATDGTSTITLPSIKAGVNTIDLKQMNFVNPKSLMINIKNKSLKIAEIVKGYRWN